MNKYLLLISIILFSCQEEITLELPKADDKLVIEGSIENGFPPYIIITKNGGYFDPIDNETFDNLFVNDIESVEIWYNDNDGVKLDSVILEQITFFDSLPPIYTDIDYLTSLDENGVPPSLYDFSKSGRTYYLEIKWNNQVISSSTTIPEVTPLDCLWVERSENSKKDYEYDIRALYSDPADQDNFILLKSKRIQHFEYKDSLECQAKDRPDNSLKLIDAGSDILINGQSFETYFPRPKESGNPFPDGNYNAYHTEICEEDTLEFKEDIVLIKYCQIDEPSLKFWRGLVRQVGTNGNPFAEPLNLVSNINNGLGVFTGYGSVYYKVKIIENSVVKDPYTIEEGLNIIDIF
ncbi:DUF4249 domain-containing protein [Flavobacteriales bacterium]|nr:DUF4249 domain-containing protein [Flavobacteriales bacterium]